MNKSHTFKILYYISFVVSFLIYLNCLYGFETLQISLENFSDLLGLINLSLVMIFTFKTIKNKLENVNIMFPILYLIFLTIVVILTLVMNNKLIIPFIHFNYYLNFILINYLFLNIYALLLIPKRKYKSTKEDD